MVLGKFSNYCGVGYRWTIVQLLYEGFIMSKIYKGVCPCKECEKRQVGCHSNCTLYTEWKQSGVEIDKGNYFNKRIKWRKV